MIVSPRRHEYVRISFRPSVLKVDQYLRHIFLQLPIEPDIQLNLLASELNALETG